MLLVRDARSPESTCSKSDFRERQRPFENRPTDTIEDEQLPDGTLGKKTVTWVLDNLLPESEEPIAVDVSYDVLDTPVFINHFRLNIIRTVTFDRYRETKRACYLGTVAHQDGTVSKVYQERSVCDTKRTNVRMSKSFKIFEVPTFMQVATFLLESLASLIIIAWIPLHLWRASPKPRALSVARWLIPPAQRECIDDSIADLKRDIRDLKKKGCSLAFINFVILWRSITTLLPIILDGLRDLFIKIWFLRK